MERIAKHPQFAKMARKLRSEGKGYREIATNLSQAGFAISHQGVKNYITRVMSSAAKIIGEDDVIEQQAREEILCVVEQLKKANVELWGIIESLKLDMAVEGGKTKAAIANSLVRAIQSITKQLELHEKMMGNIRSAPVTVNYLDMSQNMTKYVKQYLKRLELTKAITVNEPDKVY